MKQNQEWAWLFRINDHKYKITFYYHTELDLKKTEVEKIYMAQRQPLYEVIRAAREKAIRNNFDYNLN
jgi:hypothetical protein